MEMRNRVREAMCCRVTDAMRSKIKAHYTDLAGAGAILDGYSGFELGYICGMSNPTFEAIKQAVKAMRAFSELRDKDKELILLIQDGLIARQTRLLSEIEEEVES